VNVVQQVFFIANFDQPTLSQRPALIWNKTPGMSSASPLLRWAFLIEFIAELSLGVVAFLAENGVFYPAPLPWAIVEFVMFIVNLTLWLVIAFCCTGGNGQRGSSLLRADTVYFAITSVVHFLLSLGWIIFLARSFGVMPLTWADNAAAFAVYRALFSRQYTFAALLLTFALFDTRYARMHGYVTRKMRSQRAGE